MNFKNATAIVYARIYRERAIQTKKYMGETIKVFKAEDPTVELPFYATVRGTVVGAAKEAFQAVIEACNHIDALTWES